MYDLRKKSANNPKVTNRILLTISYRPYKIPAVSSTSISRLLCFDSNDSCVCFSKLALFAIYPYVIITQQLEKPY